jgi:hypothetical protein
LATCWQRAVTSRQPETTNPEEHISADFAFTRLRDLLRGHRHEPGHEALAPKEVVVHLLIHVKHLAREEFSRAERSVHVAPRAEALEGHADDTRRVANLEPQRVEVLRGHAAQLSPEATEEGDGGRPTVAVEGRQRRLHASRHVLNLGVAETEQRRARGRHRGKGGASEESGRP